MTRPLTVHHRRALEKLAENREAFHPQATLPGVGRQALATLAERGLIETAGGWRYGDPPRYRITAAGLEWLRSPRLRNLQSPPHPDRA